jgi:ubiquinone/menaquinone biosynthesis C-methylase UbiE
MAEIKRVLKNNGVVINTLYTNETLSRVSHTEFGYKRYSAEQLKNVGECAGFTVNAEPILNGAAYCLIYQRKD